MAISGAPVLRRQPCRPRTSAYIVGIVRRRRSEFTRVLQYRMGARPNRAAVRVEAERWEGGTVLVHWGHGGTGVTLPWGCAEETAGLLAADKGDK
ncbi:FAD-dependent oxidoreductase [Streptomyces sp. NPDC015661]|uniref:FAD-dependent oxidoreductase n=1 Tax=Streptomyces sp. NPDC015661 TaxID=3364961 RepID=UPI0036F937E5